MDNFKIQVAGKGHLKYVAEIERAIIQASKVKGTGIAKRSQQYLIEKITQGKAVIATSNRNQFAGFCYIETWGHEKFVANSGLIVMDEFRGQGLAMEIKETAFRLSRELYPTAKIFGLTTSLAVMKINSTLGYKPVTFSELTDDDAFWKGCQTCTYYDILFRTNRALCLCTAMLYDYEKEEKKIIDQGEKKINGKKNRKPSINLLDYLAVKKKKPLDI